MRLLAALALGGACLVPASAGPPPPVIVLPMTRRAPADDRAHDARHAHHPHHHHHGRRRLTAPAFPVSSTAETGVFTVPLSLGSPPQTLETIVDTGSTLTIFTCAGCAPGECGTSHGVFDPEASSTAVRVACTDAACACGRPACTCGADGACRYRRMYAESSSTSGAMVSDDLVVPGGGDAAAGNDSAAAATARVTFGCATRETGSIHTQPAAGIAGLGADEAGLVDQLAGLGAIAAPAFSLCLQPPPDSGGSGGGGGGGALILGPALPPGLEDGPAVVSTPLVPGGDTSYYTVRLARLAFGGPDAAPLELPADSGLAQPGVWATGHGVVLDSGTTFTFLPSPAYKAAVDAADAAAEAAGLDRVAGPDPAVRDVCWAGKGGASGFPSSGAVIGAFPNLTLVFEGDGGGGATTAPAPPLTLPPRSYLFPHPAKARAACLGLFDNGSEGTILGGITFLDTLVQIDRTGGRGRGGRGVARFVPGVDCGGLGRQAQAELKGGGVAPPPPAPRGSGGASSRSRTTAWVAVLATVAALMLVGAAVAFLASRRASGGDGGGSGGARGSCWPQSRQWEEFEGQGTATGALGLAAPVVAAPPAPPPRPVVVELGSVDAPQK